MKKGIHIYIYIFALTALKIFASYYADLRPEEAWNFINSELLRPPFLTSLIISVFGKKGNEFSVRMPFTILWFLWLFILMKLIREMLITRREKSFYLITSSVAFFYFSAFSQKFTILLFMWTTSLLLFQKLEYNAKNLSLFTLFLSLGVLSDPISFLFIPSMLISAIFKEHKKVKNLFFLSSIPTILFLTYFIGKRPEFHFNINGFMAFLSGHLLSLQPISFLGILGIFKSKKNEYLPFTIIPLFFFLVLSFFYPHNVYWSAITYLPAVILSVDKIWESLSTVLIIFQIIPALLLTFLTTVPQLGKPTYKAFYNLYKTTVSYHHGEWQRLAETAEKCSQDFNISFIFSSSKRAAGEIYFYSKKLSLGLSRFVELQEPNVFNQNGVIINGGEERLGLVKIFSSCEEIFQCPTFFRVIGDPTQREEYKIYVCRGYKGGTF